MVFSAFSVGQQMTKFTGNVPGSRIAPKVVSGGSFTPNSTEAFLILRSQLDNQFESAVVTKYKALMQNRLNALAENLRSAYSNLLNTSLGQQIGEGAALATRSDTVLDGTDSNARAGENGFKDYGKATPGGAASALADGLSGYSRTLTGAGSNKVEFRTLMDKTRAAGDVGGDLTVTMRMEEAPPKIDDLPLGGNVLLDALGSLFGGPPAPTLFNQKLAEQKATYNVGGFWSTLNYLNNFAPRELRYQYAVGYTVNSDEAGDRDYLVNGRLVHANDIGNPGAVGSEQATGERVKWNSMDPAEGYQTEISGTSSDYGTVTNRKKAFISGLDTEDNPLWRAAPATSDGTVNIVNNVELRSGTRIYEAGDTIGGSALALTNLESGSKLETEVEQNGTYGIGGGAGAGARVTSSLFFNHYEVETRRVAFNSPDVAASVGQVVVKSGMERSKAVDASKLYQWVDSNDDGDIDKVDNADGNTDDDNIPDDLSIAGGSSKVSKSFDGKFIQSLHVIESVNKQNIVGTGTYTDQNPGAPMIGNFEIAKYEGVQRSLNMSRGIVPYSPPSIFEIDASESVPTDWYQAELLTPDTTTANIQSAGVWFPHISGTRYDASGGTGYRDQMVQLRNTFELEQEDYLNPTGFTTSAIDGVARPSYSRKTFNIVVNTPNNLSNGRLFINGQPTAGIAINDGNNTVDIGPYLQTGINTIAIQAQDINGAAIDEEVTVTADAGNTAAVNAVINSRIITGYNSINEVRFEPDMNRPNTARIASRWQARIVPKTSSASTTLLKQASDPLYTGTSFKAANSFAELLIEALNKKEYRDIYKMGLISNLNKLLIQGSGNTPSGASIQGSVSLFYDQAKQSMSVSQDKLVAKGGS